MSSDDMWGGEGADTFYFGSDGRGQGELDHIHDFDPAEDSLVFAPGYVPSGVYLTAYPPAPDEDPGPANDTWIEFAGDLGGVWLMDAGLSSLPGTAGASTMADHGL